MTLILAQTFQQHVARARIFEYFGYFLIGLVVVVLLAGLLWSIRKRFDGKSRKLFAVGSIGGLTLLVFALIVSLSIAFVATAPKVPTPLRAVAWQPPPPPPPRSIDLSIKVAADMTLTIGEQSIPHEAFEEFLGDQVEAWQREGIALENITIEFQVDPEVILSDVIGLIEAAQSNGISQHSFNTMADE